MTSPQVSQVNDKPDYTKIRGWLLAFAIYAGYLFLDGIVSLLFPSDTQRDLAQRLHGLAPKVFFVGLYANCVMLLIHLAQFVAIFRRLRVGRMLSLVGFGWKILYVLAMLPFMGALIEATKPPVSKGLSFMITATAYSVVFLVLSSWVASFVYFLRSERVKKTLVN